MLRVTRKERRLQKSKSLSKEGRKLSQKHIIRPAMAGRKKSMRVAAGIISCATRIIDCSCTNQKTFISFS